MSQTSTRTARRACVAIAIAAGFATSLVAQTPRPTHGWQASTPESEGLDAAPLRDLVSRAREGTFGNADRLVVIRNGRLVLDERFARDYREISRGKTSPIGCGIDACRDSAQLNHYNYLHPT